MGYKKVFSCEAYAKKHAELTGTHIEEIDGKYIVFTKHPSVDTTADITVEYEDINPGTVIDNNKTNSKKKK
jgi:hypothetical protein